MVSRPGWNHLAAAVAALLALAAPAARAETEVDLELVLAVDISYSMDLDELALQREGYVAAITSSEVLDAIRRGIHGRIAVAYVEWAGLQDRHTVLSWQLIDGPEAARRFGDALAAAPIRRAHRTSISGALLHSAELFDGSPYEGMRQVIDISGDGANNQGPIVTTARDGVLERGIVINGLPLMLKRPNFGWMDFAELDAYYRDCVIGGPGSFMIPVREHAQFAEAIRTKLVLEIAGVLPEARAVPVQGVATVSCTMGEQRMERYYGP